MSAKRLFAGVIAVSAMAGLAACGKGGDNEGVHFDVDVNGDGKCDDCGTLMSEQNKDWTGTVYSLVGTGSGILFENDWDDQTDDPARTFAGAYASDGKTELHTLKVDLYEGDVFEIIHDHAWDGQIGFNSVVNGSKDEKGTVLFEESPSITAISDIRVAEGQSGTYELTVKKEEGASPKLYFKKTAGFDDIVLLKLIYPDGSPCFSTNFLKHANLAERAGIYFKKGATVSAMPFTPTKTAPVMQEFGGWEKLDGTAWTGGPINVDTTLRVRYVEEKDDSFIHDNTAAEYYLIGEATYEDSMLYGNNWTRTDGLKFKRVNGYVYHNVYELKNVVLAEDDKFQIAWGDGLTSQFEWFKNSPVTADGQKAVLRQSADAVYDIRLVVNVDASQNVTSMYIELVEVAAIPYGYYLVGTHLDPTFGEAADAPFNQSNYLWRSGTEYHIDIIVSESMLSVASGGQYAEFLIKWYQKDGNGPAYGVSTSGGTATGVNDEHIKLPVGVWTIYFHSDTKVIEWVEKA